MVRTNVSISGRPSGHNAAPGSYASRSTDRRLARTFLIRFGGLVAVAAVAAGKRDAYQPPNYSICGLAGRFGLVSSIKQIARMIRYSAVLGVCWCVGGGAALRKHDHLS